MPKFDGQKGQQMSKENYRGGTRGQRGQVKTPRGGHEVRVTPLPVGLRTCMVEVCSMIDTGLFARSPTEHFRLPCIKMRIKMDDRDWTICSVHAAKQWERYGVIASKSYEAR